MAQDSEQQTQQLGKAVSIAYGILIFLIVWSVLGLVAFVMSIVCFSRSGTTGQHVAGLLLALFFGPFYFIYYAASPGYCRALPRPNARNVR